VGSEEDEDSDLIVQGFYKSFEPVIARPNDSDMSLEVEGLT
jgi:hypothetical protein